MEESALPDTVPLSQLDCVAMVRRSHFPAHVSWSSDIFVIPEFAFGVDAGDREIRTSNERKCYMWTGFDSAFKLLKWDSNRNCVVGAQRKDPVWQPLKRCSRRPKSNERNATDFLAEILALTATPPSSVLVAN